MDGAPSGDAKTVVRTGFADSQKPDQYHKDGEHSIVADAWNWTEKNVVAPFVNSAVIEPINATAVNAANLGANRFGNHFNELTPMDVNKHANGFEKATQVVSGGVGTALVYWGAMKLTGAALRTATAGLSEESLIANAARNPFTSQIAGPTLYEGMRTPREGESRIGNMIATSTAIGAFGIGGSLTSEMRGIPLIASRAGIGAAGLTSGRVLADLYDHKTPTADEIYKTALTGGILNSLIPMVSPRTFRLGEAAKTESTAAERPWGENPRDARKLASGLGESIEKQKSPPTVVGSLDGSMAIIQANGSCASFVNGKWQPGIAFDSRDFITMAKIEDPDKVAKLLNDAAASLAKSIEGQ
ncbi:MAG TPA: hypothetical protein V6C76_03045 [Drouetiella sp.]